MPSVSQLELTVRYTHCIWAMLHELRVKVPASRRLGGVSFSPSTGAQGAGESEKDPSHEVSFVSCSDRDSALTRAVDRLDRLTCKRSWTQGHDFIPSSLSFWHAGSCHSKAFVRPILQH